MVYIFVWVEMGPSFTWNEDNTFTQVSKSWIEYPLMYEEENYKPYPAGLDDEDDMVYLSDYTWADQKADPYVEVVASEFHLQFVA